MKTFVRPIAGTTRRDFVRHGFGAAVASLAPSAGWAQGVESCGPEREDLAVPNFTRILRFSAGQRPHRDGSYRLEAVPEDGRLIVHSYGYGGAGITMSWGCAHQVRKILINSNLLPGNPDIAILGAGVIGLTTAMLLAELNLGLKITLYADKFSPDTTSDVAGGQWAPSSVDHDGHDDEFSEILKNSWNMHLSRGAVYGVSRRPNYVLHRPTNFDNEVPRTLVPEPLCVEPLPFPRMRTKGYRYKTLLVEPPIFLPKLHGALGKMKGVAFKKVPPFKDRGEVFQTCAEKIIVNCTGLGSAKLWPDPALYPVKGQLALLQPQPRLDYLFSGLDCHAADGRRSWFQYMFPRKDAVVIGGTYEPNADGGPIEQVCRMLIERMRRVFAGLQQECENAPFPV